MGLATRFNLTHYRRESRAEASAIVPKQSRTVTETGFAVAVLQSMGEILRLENDWRDLEHRCQDPFTFFQTFDWCVGWLQFQQCARNEASEVLRPAVVTVRSAGKLILVCPLMERRTVAGTCNLSLIGEPHTQYGNILIDPQEDSKCVLEAFWSQLCRMPGMDTLRFNAVPSSGTLGVFLEEVATRVSLPNESALMDFSAHEDWVSYQRSLSSGHRRGRTKRRNRLGRAGKLSFVILWPGDDGFEQALRDAVRFKRDWIYHTGRVSEGLLWNELEDFLLSIPGDAASMQGLIVHALRLDGGNIAIELGFMRHGDYFCFLGGFDWALKSFSPGKVQIESSFRWFLENGIERYDFLPNPADYKSGWTNARVDVASFSHHLNLRGRAVEAVAGPRMRHRLKTLFYRLPGSVRHLAGAVFRAR